MYKALMGARAPVYGDHVELTESMRRGGRQVNIGDDFASTVGLGGVIGTKFVWPQTDAKYQREALTPEKNLLWKKWTDIFHEKMLPSGDFLNLYTIGYDSPEGYVVRKAGRMYYAFFAANPDENWKGELDLRGLTPGRYRVFDYPGNKDLGVLDARSPRVAAEFTGSLLLEVSRQ
jgi:alpha-galactosidase